MENVGATVNKELVGASIQLKVYVLLPQIAMRMIIVLEDATHMLLLL